MFSTSLPSPSHQQSDADLRTPLIRTPDMRQDYRSTAAAQEEQSQEVRSPRVSKSFWDYTLREIAHCVPCLYPAPSRSESPELMDPSEDANRGRLPTLDPTAVHRRSLSETRSAISQQDHTPSSINPVLANGGDLCRETQKLLSKKALSIEISTVIPTTYGLRHDHSTAENLAANLILELNLSFEECVQGHIEHNPHFTESIKKAVALIHQELKIESIDVNAEDPLGQDHRQRRIDFVQAKLKTFYPEEAVDELFKAADGSETVINEFIAKHPLSGTPDEVSKAIQYVKLVGKLWSQHPYFGGSHEYKECITDSFEYWVYHISMLVRDPDLSFTSADGVKAKLPKPLRGYQTPKDSPLPHFNQRNLGSGVTEILWDELPKGLKRSIHQGIADFRNELNSPEGTKHQKIQNFSEQFRQVLHKAYVEMGRTKPEEHIDAKDLWNTLNEDDKKFLFADIVETPWSSAHLHEGRKGYEQTLDTKVHTEALKRRLPLRTKSVDLGLMNTAGYYANVLEKPEVAADKYIMQLRSRFSIEPDKDEFVLEAGKERFKFSLSNIRKNFIDKHQDWYEDTYESHQPIVGGVSGHTLAFLNLYRMALDSAAEKRSPEEMKNFPTLETFRGIMLAALTGSKRHHGYGEVYISSVGMELANGAEALHYHNRGSYQDIFESNDPHIKNAAVRSRTEVSQAYLERTQHTVLRIVHDEMPELADELKPKIKAYFDALGKDSPHKIRDAKNDIEKSFKTHIAQRSGTSTPVGDFSVLL